MKKLLALALTALLVTACEPAPTEVNYPQLRYTTKPVFRLAVQEVQWQDNIQPTANNVEPDFPVRLTDSLRNWGNDRLLAVGGTGVLVISIDDATAKEVSLSKEGGVRGYFTDQQDARYDASVKVTFKLYPAGSTYPEAVGEVFATRSRSINEKATLAQREDFYYKLTQDIMAQFDSAAENRLRQYFSRYMR